MSLLSAFKKLIFGEYIILELKEVEYFQQFNREVTIKTTKGKWIVGKLIGINAPDLINREGIIRVKI